MAFPSYRSSADATTGFLGGTSTNIDKPTGTIEGDLVVLAIGNVSNLANINNPTGGAAWIAGPTVSAGSVFVKTWYKWAGASEPATYGISIGSSTATIALIATAADVHQSNAPIAATSTTRTATTISTPGITPASIADLEFRFAFANAGSALAFTPPATYTERQDQQSSSTTIAAALATKELPSAAATGALDFTTSVNNTAGGGVTFAIGPASFPQTVTPSAIASGEAFGTPQFNFVVTPSGVVSGEAFGDQVVATPEAQTIIGEGVVSGEAFGSLTTRLYLTPAGITSGEAFGSPRMAALIGPAGIASAEAFGTTNVAIEQFVTATGVTTGEAFGTPALQLGYPQTIIPVGIESHVVVEDPFVRLLHRLVLVNPSIQETPAAWDRLNIRFGVHRGISIIKDAGGVWSSVRYPAQTEIEEATTVYMGGRRHVLTVAEAEELTTAGYGSYITLELIT